MEKLRFAVIGVSKEGVGNIHSKAVIQHKDTVLQAICEVNEEWLELAKTNYNPAFTCTDYHDLLDRDDIDAVIVCAPDQIHHTIVSDFLKAGKHVLCEKPMVLHSEQAKMILDAEKESSAKFMVGQVCRKTPAFILAKQMVDEGMIGDLTYIESEYAHDYSHMPIHWRHDKKDPRHIVTGGGCHAVDLLRWIAGNPTEAFAYANKKYMDDVWPTDDTAAAVMKFPNNVIGRVFVSQGIKGVGPGIRTILYGTKGQIRCSAVDPSVTLYTTELDGRTEMLGRRMDSIAITFGVEINNHNMYGELCDFVDIILNDKEVTIPAMEGACTVAVCEAIVKSTQTGKAEPVVYPEA